MGEIIFTALALVLVIEGILPFLSPRLTRESMLQLAKSNDRTLRGMGLFCMLAGVALLYIIR